MWGMEKLKKTELQQENSEIDQKIAQYSPKIEQFLAEINQLILDKSKQTQLALTCLLAGGHV